MRTPLISRLLQVWLRLRYSYWFIPAVMMVLAVALAFLLLAVDRSTANGSGRFGWAYAGGIDGAREVLSVIAGSMITVAGVVFSITVVALQLASSQFGPRILRNFMRDRGNQFVLGTFVATFVYSLLILRTIHGDDAGQVPGLSVSVAVLLAVASLAVLIFYIHHAATSIQAPQIVHNIGLELFETIDRNYPASSDAADHASHAGAAPSQEIDEAMQGGAPLSVTHTGYIQGIDDALILRLAREHELVVHLVCRPGSFVSPETIVMRIWPSNRADDRVKEVARDSVSIGSTRTHEQDVLFAAEQLAEVAVRSLSPGINDPFTAMSCVDWLGAALIRVVRRAAPSPHKADADGTVRFVAGVVTLDELLEISFGRIRTYAHGHPSVMRTLLERLVGAWSHARDDEQRKAVSRHVRLTLAAAERTLDAEEDLTRLQVIARTAFDG